MFVFALYVAAAAYVVISAIICLQLCSLIYSMLVWKDSQKVYMFFFLSVRLIQRTTLSKPKQKRATQVAALGVTLATWNQKMETVSWDTFTKPLPHVLLAMVRSSAFKPQNQSILLTGLLIIRFRRAWVYRRRGNKLSSTVWLHPWSVLLWFLSPKWHCSSGGDVKELNLF